MVFGAESKGQGLPWGKVRVFLVKSACPCSSRMFSCLVCYSGLVLFKEFFSVFIDFFRDSDCNELISG